MTATSTLAHSSLAPHSPLARTSGHGTPSHGSRSNTPVRVKPVNAHTAEHSDKLSSRPNTPVRRSASAQAIRQDTNSGPHASHSANVLLTAAPPSPRSGGVSTRRRRLSIATYGDRDDDAAPGAESELVSFQPQPLIDALTPRTQTRQRAPLGLPAALPSCVMEVQLPLAEYATLGPEASVAHAAALLAAEPAVRCVAVVAPGATHVLGREDVERVARYSHAPASETLGAFLGGTPPAPAVRASAGLGAAAGLLLGCSDDFLPLVADEGGNFLGLVSRADLASALLGDGRDVCVPQQPPSAQRGSGPAPAAGVLAAEGGGLHAKLVAGAASVAAAGAAGAATAGRVAPMMPQPSMPLPPSPTGADAAHGHALGEWHLPGARADPQHLQQQHHHHHDDGAASHVHSHSYHQQQQQPHNDQQQQHHHHQQQQSSSTSSVLGSMDAAGPAEGLRSVSDPVSSSHRRSGWDLLDNVDDALDVLGLVGRSVNAEAVGRQLLGEVANLAGGTSGTGWLFKYLYDGDCAICRTFQAMIEKMDNGVGRVIFVDISNAGFNALDHGGINYRAAMETMHILSANGEVFKGVTAVIKLLAAVDANCAAHLSSLTAVLPLLSLAYMLISRNRQSLSGAWARVVRLTGIDRAVFGRDILGPVGLGGSALGPRPARGQEGKGPVSPGEERLQPQASS